MRRLQHHFLFESIMEGCPVYELIQVTERNYYIQSPAKIGLIKLSDQDVCLIDSGNDKDAGRKVRQLLDVGGVCPFAINEGVTVYLDESLKRFQTVFPACGSSNSAIELTIDE